LLGPSLAGIVKRSGEVLEQLALPLLEHAGLQLLLAAQARDGDLLDQVPFEKGDILLGPS
jgi:hypothetical protein